jgi:hypothetical protein
MRYAGYVIVLAAVVLLLWPGSPAGQAVQSVTGSVSAMLRTSA